MTQPSEVAPFASPREVFERLVSGVSEKRWEELPDLYAEDAVVEHPMAPPPIPQRLEGREQLREHFAAAAGASGGRLEFRPRNVVVHETTDPEVIVCEFDYHGRVVDTGRPFTARNVFVMRVRDGRIVSSRDYVDHRAFAEAVGS